MPAHARCGPTDLLRRRSLPGPAEALLRRLVYGRRA
ncbi:putative membrane protein YeiB [Streptomonospora nanhaiensis]|uniref:Putative membrane protein YeiB n=1 Tax=Streptomonospora nanhaiensis TaxID=1323731 RepID=A0A853BJC9_9ACTN|nr:putative membrane protein YeiB [Streptomonospora nanhaiensis]